jgi:polysaccharide export outer membrane protein
VSKPFGAALAVIAAAAVLAGCAERRGGPIPYDVGTFGTPDALKIATLETDYKIAPLDTLTVNVFKMPELTGEYEVDLAGQISMPLIGNVDAVELTTAELDQQLTSRFGEKYLENPDVSVGVKASTRRSVTVDGAVKESGSFPVIGPLTLMQAVALAGGTTEEANSRRIAVFRQISGRRQAAAFDLASIRKGESPDPAIYAGDIVVIDGSGIKAVQKQLLNSIPILSIFRPF